MFTKPQCSLNIKENSVSNHRKEMILCSPTKLMKRCATCYRRRVKPSERQSYSNFYDECRKDKNEYYIKVESKDGRR